MGMAREEYIEMTAIFQRLKITLISVHVLCTRNGEHTHTLANTTYEL